MVTICAREFSEIDHTEDDRRIDRRTLIAHVEDDQIVTIKASAGLAAVIVVDATLKASPGRSHMVPETRPGRSNSDAMTLDHVSRARCLSARAVGRRFQPGPGSGKCSATVVP